MPDPHLSLLKAVHGGQVAHDTSPDTVGPWKLITTFRPGQSHPIANALGFAHYVVVPAVKIPHNLCPLKLRAPHSGSNVVVPLNKLFAVVAIDVMRDPSIVLLLDGIDVDTSSTQGHILKGKLRNLFTSHSTANGNQVEDSHSVQFPALFKPFTLQYIHQTFHQTCRTSTVVFAELRVHTNPFAQL